MAKYRIVHQQNSEGEILIDDIEQGLPNKPFGFLYKQKVYIPYNFKTFNVASSGEVSVTTDNSTAGYVDLVQSDDVEKSVNNGDISKLQSNSEVSVVNISAGDLDAPSISSVTHDADGSQTNAYVLVVTVNDGTGSTGDYTITINGTDFTVSDSDSGSDNSASLATDLESAVNGGGEPVTASKPNSDEVKVVADSATNPFTHSVNTTDSDGSISESVTDTGVVVVEGSNLSSTNPDTTSVKIDDGSNPQTFSESDITSASGTDFNGALSDSRIVIPNSLHGFGNSAGTINSVDVTADRQTDTQGTITEE